MKSKPYIPTWVIALVSALALHIIIITLLNLYGGFALWQAKETPAQQQLEVTFVHKPNQTSDETTQKNTSVSDETAKETAPTVPTTSSNPNATDKVTGENPAPNRPHINSEGNITAQVAPSADDVKTDQDVDTEKTGDISTKSSLLDLSHFSLSPAADSNATREIFSAELQKKIAASKQAQKDYLKGTKREISYPITEDADGTRYVNIKGVCWRMPKDPSKDSWAIVFDGCGLKDKSFHFELNISPSMLTNELLGPESPFTLEK
ncbi:hypothetical protein [Marinomonas arenicola]|uniref:Uncharacterized protein n=1 Tax=Marinomonas arenicola TaxID=569601 RepID=A0ABU9GD13_9GAMM